MIDLLEITIIQYGVMAAFLLMMSNGIFSAPPSELVLALVGAILVNTYDDLIIMAGLISIGNLIGAYILYYFGRKYGISILIWFRNTLSNSNVPFARKISLFIPQKKRLIRYRSLFKENGGKWVLLFRCLPVVRSIISLPAGAAEMPAKKFLICSYIGMYVWACVWVGFGYSLKHAWVNYQARLSIPFIFALLLVSGYIVYRLIKLSDQLSANEISNN